MSHVGVLCTLLYLHQTTFLSTHIKRLAKSPMLPADVQCSLLAATAKHLYILPQKNNWAILCYLILTYFREIWKKVKSRQKRESAKSPSDARKFHKRELRVSAWSICSSSWMNSHDPMGNQRYMNTYVWDTDLVWRTSSKIWKFYRMCMHILIITYLNSIEICWVVFVLLR